MAILQEVKVPLLAVNDTTLIVSEIPFKNGDKVHKGNTILTFETSKTTYDLEAEFDGFIKYYCEIGQEYNVNDLVVQIFSERSDFSFNSASIDELLINTGEKKAPTSIQQIWQGDPIFSLKAMDLIEKNGIEKSRFNGKDFVSYDDVEVELGLKPKGITPIVKAIDKKEKVTAPSLSLSGRVELQPLTTIKKREIDFLQAVQKSGLTSLVSITIEMAGIFDYINVASKYFKNALLPIITYEVSRLLQKYRVLNAYFADDSIAFYEDINIGFAIDIDKGLKVLNIKNTSEKNIQEIEKAIFDLSNRYIDDKIQVSDLMDITFTITDLSNEGINFFYPLINMMNSAILGVSAIDQKLQRCTLSLTFDHRVTEGKIAARFLQELKGRLESYRRSSEKRYTSNLFCFKCLKTLKEDMSGIGLLKCVSPVGEEAYVCQSCINGL